MASCAEIWFSKESINDTGIASYQEKNDIQLDTTTVHSFGLALFFFLSDLLLKHVQIRQGLQRADALCICPDDLLVVEKYPGALIVFRTNMRNVVARVDRRTFV